MKLALVDTFEEKGSTSPLGLMSIATYLREHGFKDATIIDVAVDDVLAKLDSLKPDAVGISAYTFRYNRAILLARMIKELYDIPVFIGGAHITLAPYSLDPVFDFGVVGEGEQTTLELVEALEAGKPLSNIHGLVFPRSILTPKRELIDPLDLIPIPDRSLASQLYFSKLRSFNGQELVEGNILTSRGCLYRCPFCATSLFWQKLRFNSVERVVEEVSYLKDTYHVTCINIWDDFFTISKKRVGQIVDALVKEHLTEDLQYRVQVRVNTFDTAMAKLLKKMNVTNLNFGLETGSQRMLNIVKKDVTVEQIKKAVHLGCYYNFQVTGSLIFGMPEETLYDMRQTLQLIDYCYQEGAAYIWFFVATPYPSTVWWEQAKELGTVSDDMDWDLLDLKKTDQPLLLNPSVPIKDFQQIIRLANRKTRAYFRLHAQNRPLSKSVVWALKHPRSFLEAAHEYLKAYISTP